MASRGLVVAGLSSGSGKTTVTLGLLRALTRTGTDLGAAKSGPDYIDAAFLTAACGSAAVNLDSHAMPIDQIRQLASGQPRDLLLVEGVMGLFDGTDGGSGSTASVAAALGVPIMLVIDCRHQAQTAAALAAGIASQLPADSSLAGVVLNRVASPRHEALISAALAGRGIRLFGSLPFEETIAVPSRHLGLVQAADLAARGTLEPRIEAAADLVAAHLDLSAITTAFGEIACATAPTSALPPPGQRIALARDAAFGFAYEHMMAGWRSAGAEIIPFSPLADEAPDDSADFIFIPGGYPELHLPTLAGATRCLDGLRRAAAHGTGIYGECGGYMVLGETIIDKDGTPFAMAGLLRLETSFASRKLHLGYRQMTPLVPFWPGLKGSVTGHEFHYTTAIRAEGDPLFAMRNAGGDDLGNAGLVAGLVTGLVTGPVAGSYAHIIA